MTNGKYRFKKFSPDLEGELKKIINLSYNLTLKQPNSSWLISLPKYGKSLILHKRNLPKKWEFRSSW